MRVIEYIACIAALSVVAYLIFNLLYHHWYDLFILACKYFNGFEFVVGMCMVVPLAIAVVVGVRALYKLLISKLTTGEDRPDQDEPSQCQSSKWQNLKDLMSCLRSRDTPAAATPESGDEPVPAQETRH